MIPDLSLRSEELEWMDTRVLSAEVLESVLSFLEMTNRVFGGARLILANLERWARTDETGPLTVLDVGTGAGDIPLAIARWARARGRDVRITAIDLVPKICEMARERTWGFPDITIRCADVRALPAEGERFQFVIGNLLLHHIPPAELASALQTMDGLATRGMIFGDLERTLPAYVAVSAASWMCGNHVVKNDGPASVRRAFRARELQAMATAAGLDYLTVRREPWFRLSLSGAKP